MMPIYRAFFLFLGIPFFIFLPLTGGKEETKLKSCRPLHEVATLGASTSGAFIEGMAGSCSKVRQRFTCYSNGPNPGFVGSQSAIKLASIKSQPGVFPAPLVGPASLNFIFSSNQPKKIFTPVVIKPDGTAFYGLPMESEDSPQILIISAPAQIGIYTLFVLSHQTNIQKIEATVDVVINVDLNKKQTFYLTSLQPTNEECDCISAEFIYSPAN